MAAAVVNIVVGYTLGTVISVDYTSQAGCVTSITELAGQVVKRSRWAYFVAVTI